MTRLAGLFWLAVVLASGFATFTVKYAVQGIDQQLQQSRKQIVADEEQLRVLTAEWNYLNRPSRLADLNQRFLRLVPISTKQLEQKIADIPFRAPAFTAAESSALPAAVGEPTVAGRPIATADRSAALPIAEAGYDRSAAADGLPVYLARAMQTPTGARSIGELAAAADRQAPAPASLDALFAQVAEAR